MSTQDFCTFLEEFEQLACQCGEQKIADRVQQIRTSPDPVGFLRKLLAPRKKKPDHSLERRVAWFKDYRSGDGDALLDKDAYSLATLTRGWDWERPLEELTVTAVLWFNFPFIFWEGQAPHVNKIQSTINLIKHKTDTDETQKKVLLVTLSEDVEGKQKELFPEDWKQTTTSDCRRPHTSLKESLTRLVRELWPDGDNDGDGRVWLTEHSLWGWKWRQLDHPGIILSLSRILAMR